jgi:hypothetical protein
MNHSLLTADRATHLKIVAVALAAAVVTVVVGGAARVADVGAATVRVDGATLASGAATPPAAPPPVPRQMRPARSG